MIHIQNEYDYMFESEYRSEIFDALKYRFHQINGYNLPIFGVNDKLKDYATTKKDISNGYQVQQKDEFRINSEDIYEETKDHKNMSTSASSGSAGYKDEVQEWNDEVQNSVAYNMYSKDEK